MKMKHRGLGEHSGIIGDVQTLVLAVQEEGKWLIC